MSTTRYIELVSSRRNRTQYPLPSNYEVPLNWASGPCYDKYLDSLDPVSNSAPVWIFNLGSVIPYDTQQLSTTFALGALTSNANPQLDSTGPAPYGTMPITDISFAPQAWWQSAPYPVQNNLYRAYQTDDSTKGYLLQDGTIGDIRKITGLSKNNEIVSLDYSFGKLAFAGDQYDLIDGSNSTNAPYDQSKLINVQPYDLFGRKGDFSEDFFTNKWIVLDNVRSSTYEEPISQRIVKFNSNTREVKVNNTFVSAGGSPIVFSIRKEPANLTINGIANKIIISSGAIGSVGTSTITSATPLTPLTNGEDPGYVGTFVYIKPDPEDPVTYVNYPSYPTEGDVNSIQKAYIYRVIGYTTDNVLELDRAIDLTNYWSGTLTPVDSANNPVIRTFEILPVSYDNFSPLNYSGSVVSQSQQVCYEVGLTDITLPNTLLTAGGKIAFYPYIYVKLENVTMLSYKSVTYTNAGGDQRSINPYGSEPSETALFVVPIVNIVRFATISPFVRLSGYGITQTIKFKPNDALRVSVFLPNGSLFDTVAKDNIGPLPPNPLLQISVTFSIKRL